MIPEDIKRLHYYERQFLRTQDFQDEQAYHIEMRRRHLIAQHSWGVVVGLEITRNNSGIWFVQPGMAVDGYGREILVFEPEPLDVSQIESRISGDTLKVWMAYRVEKSDRPAAGYEFCRSSSGAPDQFTRIREAFRLIYQNDPPSQDQTNPYPPYEPLEDNATAYPWPIYLGTVQWNSTDKTITGVEANKRRYVGLIGAEITPPLVAQSQDATGNTVAPALKNNLTLRADETHIKGLNLGESGRLVVDGNVQLNGSRLELRSTGGAEPEIPLQMSRQRSKDFHVQIGNGAGQEARFVVGPGNEEKLVVNGNGDITLSGNLNLAGTKNLNLEGGHLSLKNAPGSSTGAGEITDITRKFNAISGHQDLQVGIGSSDDPGTRLVVGPKDGDTVQEKFVVSNDGKVGIGTGSPNRALTVQGNSGTYINIEANNGSREILVGADSNGGIVSTMTNHDLLLRAGNNNTGVTIKADGKVGVGTQNPNYAFEVQGDRIRLENSGKRLDLRTDGGAVDLQTETNNLYIRSTNHNLIVNPYPNDGDVGIGIQSPDAFFHVNRNKSNPEASNREINHVAIIENGSFSSAADVLALKLPRVISPEARNDFITFFGGDNIIGQIDRRSDGIRLRTGGADYAESLPRLYQDEEIHPGEIVGIFAGKVTLVTHRAHHISVISDQSIVVGNVTRDSDSVNDDVAFVGQVPVKIRGSVKAGDYIVPSGLNDGTGVAVDSRKLTPEHCDQIVGRAWENSDNEDVKLINIVVGLPSNFPGAELLGVIQKQQLEIRKLSAEMSEMKSMILALQEKTQ
jgi:hypothetical protein